MHFCHSQRTFCGTSTLSHHIPNLLGSRSNCVPSVLDWPQPLSAGPHRSKHTQHWSTTRRRTPRLPALCTYLNQEFRFRYIFLKMDLGSTKQPPNNLHTQADCRRLVSRHHGHSLPSCCHTLPRLKLGLGIDLSNTTLDFRIKKGAFRDCSPATWAATAFTSRPVSSRIVKAFFCADSQHGPVNVSGCPQGLPFGADSTCLHLRR